MKASVEVEAVNLEAMYAESDFGSANDVTTLKVVTDLQMTIFHERPWIGWLKFLTDVAAMNLAMLFGFLVRSSFSPWWPISFSIDQYWDLSLGILLVPFGFWLHKLYPGYGLNPVERLSRRVKVTFSIFLALSLWDYLIQGEWSRGVYASAFCFALILPPIFQSILRRTLIRLNLWGTPVLILGAGKTCKILISTLNNDKEIGLRPAAVFDDNPSKWNTEIEEVPVLGSTKSAYDFVGKVRYVIIAMPGANRQTIVELTKNLPFPHILLIPNLFGIQSLWVDTRDINGVVSLELRKNLLLKRNWLAKRTLDYFLGIPLLLVSLPFIAIAAAWIKIVSPGNPFYAQVREGIGGKKIKVWKLRTMYSDSELLLKQHLAENTDAKREWESFFKLKNDPRILPGIGKILRKTSLDELPQFWNLLRGEVSLVGPRPFPHYHLERFNGDFLKMRRSVIPGITGLWQVSARSDGDLRVQENLDTYYIRNWSIWLDLSILARTIQVVLTGKGAC